MFDNIITDYLQTHRTSRSIDREERDGQLGVLESFSSSLVPVKVSRCRSDLANDAICTFRHAATARQHKRRANRAQKREREREREHVEKTDQCTCIREVEDQVNSGAIITPGHTD